ncbi:hypothetical protein Tco_0230940 [Tanacetum coccineum]
MLDACTSDMCLNPWGRNTYARVLVEISSEHAIMESVVAAIPFPNGSGHSLETLDVEYEWRPSRCSKCKIFDHVDEFCPSRDKKADPSSTSENGGMRDIGNVGTTQTIRMNGVKQPAKAKNIQGIRFTKPKSKLIYRHVAKVNQVDMNNMKDTSPVSKEDAKMADVQPNDSFETSMDGFLWEKDKSTYIQDDIDLIQLRNNMDRLMEEDKVLDINTDSDLLHDFGTKTTLEDNECSNSIKSVQEEVKCHEKGNEESDEDEVYLPDNDMSNFISSTGGGFNMKEDDLDYYKVYEAQIYDLPEQMHIFCDQYDIRLKSHVRK